MESRGLQKVAGFTLIELIAVVVIVGVMVTLAATRLDHLVPKYRLRGAARELGASFKQAKARAAATGRDVYVELDLTQGSHWLLAARVRTREDATGRVVVEVPYERFFLRRLPAGVEFVDILLGPSEKITRGTARLRMSPLGASNHTIVNLKNSEGREIAVKHNGFTGFVTYHDGYQEADEILQEQEP